MNSNRPAVEGLEGRLLLYATNGGEWTLPARVTYSFMPDGTSLGGPASNLYQTFNSKFTTATWQAAFTRAAAYWAVTAGINIVQVPDNGAALGANGNQQGDPNFGDIRIGGMAQSMNTLAIAFLPPPVNGDSLAGDILFNTAQAWQMNNDYDIQTVALHEFGHALGLDHSATTSAAMYAYYNGQKQSPINDDLNGIQAVYGTRQPDNYEGPNGNDTISTATDLNQFLNPSTNQIALYYLDMQQQMDNDYYRVNVPSGTNGTMVVRMQSSNLSMLSPRVQVLDSAGKNVNYTTAPNSYGTTISVTVNGVTPGQLYYIRANGANTGTSGAYALLLNFGSTTQYLVGPPNTAVAKQASSGGGSQSSQTVGDPASTTAVTSAQAAEPTGSLRSRLRKLVENHDDDVPELVQVGEVQGYADSLRVSPAARRRLMQQAAWAKAWGRRAARIHR